MKPISFAAIILFVSSTLVTSASQAVEEAQLTEEMPTQNSEFSSELADASYLGAAEQTEDHDSLDETPQDELFEATPDSVNAMRNQEIHYIGDDDAEYDDTEAYDYQDESLLTHDTLEQIELPGEDIDFKLKLYKKTLYLIDGRATSKIGKILFKSRLMPNNEVKLSVKLKQGDLKDIELVGYFDIAQFTMELDGSNAVLNQQHKELLSVLDAHLRAKLTLAYSEYDFPEHAFMLMQMLSYWSVSPEGYVHEKREIVANH